MLRVVNRVLPANRFRLVVLAALLSLGNLVACGGPEQKEQPKAAAGKKDIYVRLERDDKNRPRALQTALVRYTKADDPKLTVDLIGAIHVGDKAYYDGLNRRFAAYEALLYELVASPEKKVPKPGQRSAHPIGAMQHGMKDMLQLEHQLDLIDYKKPNFVHADMSPAEFSQAMADRGESIWTMMFRMMGQGMAMQGAQGNSGGEFDLLMALFDRNRSLALKRAMAEQFEVLEGNLDALDGPGGSAIITDRNKKALKVLREQIDAGKKNIGIFYGAGHLADMDKRLVEEFGMKRQKTEWVTAWDMPSPAKTERPKSKKAAEPAKKAAQ